MTGTKYAVLAGVLLASSVAIGCGGPGYAHGYVAYSVPAPPPAPYAVGPLGYAPGPGYAWVSGYWNLNAGRWGWVNGRWAVPPHGRSAWVADRWERHGSGYHFHRGYWR